MLELQEGRILFNVLLSCFEKCPLHCPLSHSVGISPWGVLGFFFLAWILEKNNISAQHSSTSLKPTILEAYRCSAITFVLVSVCQQQLCSSYCPFILHWSGADDYKYADLCSCVSCLSSDRHNSLSHPSAEQKPQPQQLIIFVLLKWKGEKQYDSTPSGTDRPWLSASIISVVQVETWEFPGRWEICSSYFILPMLSLCCCGKRKNVHITLFCNALTYTAAACIPIFPLVQSPK